jgi:hypothetical protein
MLKKIKGGNFFSFYKKYILSAFSLIFIGILTPSSFALGDFVTSLAAYTAGSITAMFLLTTATVSLVFSTFSDWFLRIVISDSFVNIPYTSGNEFVAYGWSVARDFVNMFFILILIIIGLSTSLQIETYKWQKTLPRLVFVALFINFTLVFLGVFIDATNIMMNYFVSSLATESVFVMRMRSLYEVMSSSLANTPWTSFTGAIITPVAMSVIFTIFNFFIGLVYSIYGLIFAMRYVAIWLLVIISPFGFFCYILPATRGFFNQWWRWFLGWCIIGVAGSFFLYLGEIMFQFIDQTALVPSVTEHQGMEIGVFVQTFPLVIPLLFISFGLFATIAISFSSSRGIISGFQKASGLTRKSFSQLPGSTVREKAASASVAIKNAFQVAPAISPISTQEKGGSTKREGGSLYRRQTTGETEKSTMETGLTNRSMSQITSVASEGFSDATVTIANEVEKTERKEENKETLGKEEQNAIKEKIKEQMREKLKENKTVDSSEKRGEVKFS